MTGWEWRKRVLNRISGYPPYPLERPCGCLADPLVFGHLCQGNFQRAAEDTVRPAP